MVGRRPQHASSKLACLVLSSARSCHSSICPGRLFIAWLVFLVIFSCHMVAMWWHSRSICCLWGGWCALPGAISFFSHCWLYLTFVVSNAPGGTDHGRGINDSPSTQAKLADIQKALAHNAWSHILFVHAITGFDTIPALYNIWKQNKYVCSGRRDWITKKVTQQKDAGKVACRRKCNCCKVVL